MKGLLIKDFMRLKNQKKVLILIIIVWLGLVGIKENMSIIAISWITFIGAWFSIGSIGCDEKDNGNAFLFSLPITRRGYVLEKYVLSLVTGGTCWLISIVTMAVINIAKKTFVAEDILMLAFIPLSMAVLLISILFPLFLKFGTNTATLAVCILYAGVVIMYIAIEEIGLQLNFDIDGFIDKLLTVNTGIVTVVAFAVAVCILALSYMISVGIMQRKEF